MAWIRCTGNTGGSLKVRTASGAIASFETNMADVLQEVKCEIKATGGNGTPDNPIPINGYTEANITRCGVNLWELSEDTKQDIQGCAVDYINNGIKISANNTYARASYVYKVKAGQTYTLSYYGYGTGNFIQIYYNDAIAWNPQNYGRQQITSTRTKYTKTFTATSDIFFVGFYVTTSGTSGDMVIEDFMLEVGSSASDDFHPYNGQIYTIAFGQMVYGGVLDVTRGKLHVTRGGVDLGSLNWVYRDGGSAYAPYFYADISGVKYEGSYYSTVYHSECSIYTCTKRDVNTFVNNTYCFDGVATAVTQIQVKDNRFTNANDFKTAVTGQTLVYDLATPFDIDLTPEVISAVVGENNVWHDANGDTEVKFLEVVRN